MASFNVKAAILLVLCLQNSSFLLLLRYSRGVLKQNYLTSSTLIYTEVVKLVLSLCLTDLSNLKNTLTHAHLLLPVALIYYIQNSLMYFALHNLDAATYAVLVQLKILTCAVFFVLFVGKRISEGQWRALLLLVIGVILVQYEPDASKLSRDQQRSNLMGMLSGLGVAVCSGLASVYFEFVLKKSSTSKMFNVYDRNIQLAVWSILFGLIHIIPEYGEVLERGFFGGYSAITHVMVIWSGVGGMLVGLAVKHINSVVKNFANAAAMIVTALVSIFLFNRTMVLFHWLGILVVILSMFNYQAAQIPEGKTQNKKEESIGGTRSLMQKIGALATDASNGKASDSESPITGPYHSSAHSRTNSIASENDSLKKQAV